jgi:pimeloyl-ACP methyl ester carboxylesterase
MVESILVPQVGQDLTEAKVVALHVKVGDAVKKGDIVAEVESEKASFEVEAFASGVVLELPYNVGDTAKVLEPLVLLGERGEARRPSTGTTVSLAPANAEPTVKRSDTASAAARVRPDEVVTTTHGKQRSSPIARRLAAGKGLELSAIQGSGPRGAVVLRDVEAAAASVGTAARLLPAAAAKQSGLVLKTLQDGAGHPVVFIHGFGADLSSWRPFVGRLAIGNPMIGIDLPGHGGSAGESAEGFEVVADLVAATLLAAGHHRIHLVGHSLGAAVAAALTRRSDLDIRSLILLAPAGLGPKINGDFIEGFLHSSSLPALTAWMQRLVYSPGSLPGAFVRATLGAREGTELAISQTRLSRHLFEHSTQLFSIRDALERYEGPCRIIVGRYDEIIPADYVQSVPGNVAVNRLDLVGHLPQVEAASLVSRLVGETVRAAG